MIEVHSFRSPNPWNDLLVLGSIHGDEVCGSKAIDTVISDIRNNATLLLCGSITCIPRANRRAYEAWVRYIEYNLNRIFWQRDAISWEHHIARTIAEYIPQSDFLLDLHSLHEWNVPFAFLESPLPQAKEFVGYSHIEYVVVGWEELYSGTKDMDSVSFATSMNIPGVTIECWQHKDPTAVIHAEKSIRSAMEFLGNIKKLRQNGVEWPRTKRYVRVNKIVQRPTGAKFAKDWKNFDAIRRWEIIWYSDDGTHLAPYDGYILIPKPEWCAWEEWYYLGVSEKKAP